jgi:hypothetical protein
MTQKKRLWQKKMLVLLCQYLASRALLLAAPVITTPYVVLWCTWTCLSGLKRQLYRQVSENLVAAMICLVHHSLTILFPNNKNRIVLAVYWVTEGVSPCIFVDHVPEGTIINWIENLPKCILFMHFLRTATKSAISINMRVFVMLFWSTNTS